MAKKSLKRSTLIIALLVLLIPSLVGGLSAIFLSRQSLEREIRRRNDVINQHLTTTLADFLDLPISELSSLEHLIPAEDAGNRIRNAYLRYMVEGHHKFLKIQLADPSGIVEFVYPTQEKEVGGNVSRHAFFRSVIQSSKPYWSSSYVSAEFDRPVVSMSLPFRGGVLTSILSLEDAANIARTFKGSGSSYVSVTDQTAVFVAHSLYDKVLRREHDPAYELLIQKCRIGENTGVIELDGHLYLYKASIVPDTEWLVSVMQDINELDQPATHLGTMIGLMTACLLFLGCAVVWWSTGRIVKSLTRLQRDLENVAEGRYDLTPPENAFDELAALFDQTVRMAGKIKMREKEILDKEDNLRIILDSISDGVVAADTSGTILRMNPVAENLCGWKQQSASGKNISDVLVLLDPSSHEKVDLSRDLSAFSSGHELPGVPVNRILVNRSGRQLRITYLCASMRGSDDVLLGAVWVVRDVSRQHQMEKALAESQTRFQMLVSNVPGAVFRYWVGNGHNHVLFVSDAIETVSGYRPSEFGSSADHLVRDLRDLVIPEDRIAVKDVLRNCTTERTEYELEYRITHKDGSIRHIYERGRVVPASGKDDVFLDGVMIDMSEKVAIAGQLRHAQKMDSLGQLAGGVAHDFNNMLGGVLGYAELLTHKLEGQPDLRHFALQICRAAERSAELIAKLLAFSRKGEAKKDPLGLHDVINEALAILERSIDKRIRIETKFMAYLTTIVGDASQLQNAILNLGVNARDAMPDGGLISIKTENVNLGPRYCKRSPFKLIPGSYVCVTVQDTGTGIPPELINKIFEPFFTTKEEGKGTGLGLAAIYGTVVDHKGAITVYSECGKGTAFHLYLPVEGVYEQSDTAVEVVTSGRRGCVLLVDDEDIVREMGQEMLSDAGHEVLVAGDGIDAVESYRKNSDRIDVVILDVVMPRMNGEDCFHQLRQINPSVRVIMASGFTGNVVINKLLDEGVCAFIKKPFRQGELLQTLSDALESADSGVVHAQQVDLDPDKSESSETSMLIGDFMKKNAQTDL